MMIPLGGLTLRLMLRAILAIGLLLGSGAAGWTPALADAHESCCCGTLPGAVDRCPCPKPEGNRTPSSNACVKQAVSQAALAVRQAQGQRRVEPRPEPATWARDAARPEPTGLSIPARGRDPDLGRHLARLETFRI
ncbi:MAG: hypothetical protein IPP58_09370 [Holophagaceae bacterium]|uniref:Uncharacterized protein n=1 Tax=Candidatus Geothrix skivensis TaxID=2954439 RepID=A0A9D7SIQ1_9BACT|nr:hypothetical protein [Candidatus Geothrix skivensis]